jgi:hypothetical protein
LLRDCDGFGDLEAWIAGRRWKTAPSGWIVTGELQGWQFRIDVIPAGGLRISASAPGGGVSKAHFVRGHAAFPPPSDVAKIPADAGSLPARRAFTQRGFGRLEDARDEPLGEASEEAPDHQERQLGIRQD